MPKASHAGRWAGFLLVLAALAIFTTLGAGRALAASTLVVDDDKAQCPNAQYTTIQAAVDAAQPGDTIQVCAGTYSATTVDKQGLKLHGVTDSLRGQRCLDRTLGADPTRDSIVNGAAGSPGFSVTAKDVTIRGFTVQNASGSNGAGIYVPVTGSGVEVRDNLLQKNTMGVYLTNDGSLAARVEGNCIRDNNVAGSAAGNGVYSDAGLKNARIDGNVFTGQENASVILVGMAGTQSQVRVSKNLSTKDAPFIFANLTDSTVDKNTSVDSAGSGIFFAGGSSDVGVSGNDVSNCAFTGINVRYDPANYPVTTNNTQLSVDKNRVSGCGDAGIRLRDGATQNVVRDNRVETNGTGATKGDGISLENADSNRVEKNRSDRNGRDGMRADTDSAGNQIVRNTMSGNGEHDCHDDSVGSGTAGTANTWTGDVGATENKPGLCRAKNAKGGGDHGKGDHGNGGGKVTICHRTASGKYQRITVSQSAAQAHAKHGDIVPAPAAGCPDRVSGDNNAKGKDAKGKQNDKGGKPGDKGHGGDR